MMRIAAKDLDKARAKAAREKFEQAFFWQCVVNKLPKPERQHLFAPRRKYAFDFAWPQWKLAVEVEGGIWRRGGGAHSHPTAIIRDIVKHNLATDLGWRVYRFTTDQVQSGEAINHMARVLARAQGETDAA